MGVCDSWQAPRGQGSESKVLALGLINGHCSDSEAVGSELQVHEHPEQTTQAHTSSR